MWKNNGKGIEKLNRKCKPIGLGSNVNKPETDIRDMRLARRKTTRRGGKKEEEKKTRDK
jgi:hypothetical protein